MCSLLSNSFVYSFCLEYYAHMCDMYCAVMCRTTFSHIFVQCILPVEKTNYQSVNYKTCDTPTRYTCAIVPQMLQK